MSDGHVPCDLHHMVTSPRLRSRRPAALTVAVCALVASAGLAACKPAPPPPPPKRTVEACDPSVCLIAWEVVDTDHDGLSDADELMAGTDPFDPESRPPLAVIVRLTLDRKLPSFEWGRAFMVVTDRETQMLREAQLHPLENSAIPLDVDRKSALDGLGFDLEALTGHGIDSAKDGFTLGLEKKKDGQDLPEARIGGIPRSQISADDGGTGRIDDCCIPLEMGHGEVVEHIDYGDWQSTKWADGSQTICSNDAGCRTDPPEKGYSNPDGDPDAGGEPTDEQKKAFERRYGAAERRVEMWNFIDLDPENIVHKQSTISLFDPDADPSNGTGNGRVMLFDAPRLTNAQPEGRPDLPSPLEGAPGAPPCTAGC